MKKTIKTPINLTNDDKQHLLDYIKQFNSYVKSMYNALVDTPDATKEVLTKNLESHYADNKLIPSYMMISVFKIAKSIYNRYNTTRVKQGLEPLGHKVIFGGKKLFERKKKNLITNEEYKLKKLMPLCSVGGKIEYGNRYFKILNRDLIEFRPNKNTRFTFQLNDKRLWMLSILKKLQDNQAIPITYRLDTENIYITYDDSLVNEYQIYDVIPNRFIAFDLNPEHIGLVIFDDYLGNINIITAKDYDLSTILKEHKDSKCSTDSDVNEYYNNKRKYELREINQSLKELIVHYKCQYIVIENLKFNKLTGRKCTAQWNKTITVNFLESEFDRSNIHLLKINPAFTSIIGNIVHNYKMPDMCRSALEVGLRAITGMHEHGFDESNNDKKLRANDKHLPIVKNYIIDVLENRYNKTNDDKIKKEILQKINKVKKYDKWYFVGKFIKNNDIKFRVPLNTYECVDDVLKTSDSLVKIKTFNP